MKCWTISIKKSGEYDVTEGIKFERTEDQEIGLLKAGGLETEILLPRNFQGEVMKSALLYKCPEKCLLLGGKIVQDILGHKESEYQWNSKGQVFLELVNDQDHDSPFILIHIELEDVLIEKEDYYLNGLNEIESDNSSYSSFSEDYTSYLVFTRTSNFSEYFESSNFDISIGLNEKGTPEVTIYEDEDEDENI